MTPGTTQTLPTCHPNGEVDFAGDKSEVGKMLFVQKLVIPVRRIGPEGTKKN